MIGRVLAALLLACFAMPARASDSGLVGVWQGTIGEQAIVVCFDDNDTGSYYYEQHGRTLLLERSESSGMLEERTGYDSSRPANGQWQVAIESGELHGQWSPAAKAGPALPIRAHRLPAADDESCDSPAFDAPRLAADRLVSRRSEQEGMRVELAKARGVGVERLQLVGGDATTRFINGQLDAAFRRYLIDAYNCNSFDGPGDYSVTPSIEFSGARWLVVRMDNGSYCGGAHPNWSADFLVFARSSGEQVDTLEWFDVPDARAAEFWRLFASRVDTQNECAEAWSGGNVFVTVRPSPRGVRIAPFLSHAEGACVETAELSLDEARPYLSPEALKMLAPRE